MVIYPVIFTATHDARDTYLIQIPDLNGMTEGYGLEDAYAMARDYIGQACLNKTEEDIPAASKLSDVDAKAGEFAKAGDSFVSLVDLDLEAYRRKFKSKAVRRNVSIPGWLDQAAEEAHLNVSRILQDALMEKLGV